MRPPLRVAAQLAMLIALALVISAAAIRLLNDRGLVSEAVGPIQAAGRILAGEDRLPTAFYPPMMTAFALAVRSAGVPVIDPYVFNTAFLILGICAFYALAARVLKQPWMAFAAGLLVLLNPYFVWTLMISRDASAEFLFLGLTMYLTLSVCRPASSQRASRTLLAALLVLSMVILSLVRVTGFFMNLAVLVVGYVVTDSSGVRRILLACAAALAAFGLLWSYSNYRQVGAFQLATNGGYNLYLGNHPAFLHGYPHYDIDVFLRSENLSGLDGLTEGQVNGLYTQKAIEFIKADPAAFVYRTIMKSWWYWLSPEKLPNYTSDSRVVSPPSTVEWTALLTAISIPPGLAFLVYHLFYLAGMLASWVTLYRRGIDRALLLLFAPMLGLWPVVALTFPDTRFKISAEAVTIPVILAACLALRARNRS